MQADTHVLVKISFSLHTVLLEEHLGSKEENV